MGIPSAAKSNKKDVRLWKRKKVEKVIGEEKRRE